MVLVYIVVPMGTVQIIIEYMDLSEKPVLINERDYHMR